MHALNGNGGTSDDESRFQSPPPSRMSSRSPRRTPEAVRTTERPEPPAPPPPPAGTQSFGDTLPVGDLAGLQREHERLEVQFATVVGAGASEPEPKPVLEGQSGER
eukprot:15439707-Alexandrium_andersonii.AAC.1